MKRLSAVAIAALTLAWLCSGCGKKEVEQETGRISVNGLAEVQLVPDMLTVSLGVQTLDKDPLKSQAENDKAVKAILAMAKQLGIEPKDVKTGFASLGPKETQNAQGVPVFEGYEALTTVTVVLRDLSRYNELVTGALKGGANRVGGLSFGYLKEDEKRREARMQAVKAAKQKAEDLAGQLGLKLGRPTSIDNRERPFEERNYSGAGASGYLSVTAATTETGTTLSAGEMVIRCEVEVTFELKD